MAERNALPPAAMPMSPSGRAALRNLFRSGLQSLRGTAGTRSRVTGFRESVFFYGIAIFMYFNEGIHAVPHFHARYAGAAASVDVDGNLIAGSLPPRAQSLVAGWAALPRDELLANWDRARDDQPLESIEPLS